MTDSCTNVCIEDCNISTGGDAISIKSGWDEYGIAYKSPSSNILIRRVVSSAPTGAGFAIGSEMSGGVSNIKVEGVVISNAKSGIRMKTTAGRGGYITNVSISEVEMHNTEKAIVFSGFSGEHPDDHWDHHAYPLVERILIQNVVGENIVQAGELLGLQEAPFRHICLINIALDVLPGSPCWNCSEVAGSSSFVLPKPCPELQHPELSSSRR
jgi:polygalacturonase